MTHDNPRREPGDSCRFLVDPKLGHAAIAYSLARGQNRPLRLESVLGFTHHLLKANVNKTSDGDSSTCANRRDIQAAFLALTVADLSQVGDMVDR